MTIVISHQIQPTKEYMTNTCAISAIQIQWNFYKDHPREQQSGPYTQMVFICRLTSMESIHMGSWKMRLL